MQKLIKIDIILENINLKSRWSYISNIINYTGEDFENETVSQTGLTLVDFYAIWCGPCQMLEKVLAEVSNNSDCKIVKVDVDDYPEFGAKFKIRGLPMLLLFKDGKIVETLNGFQTFDEIMEKINLHN